MSTMAARFDHADIHPVDVRVEPALTNRNRLTTAFRIFLAIPHLILVGGPISGALYWVWAPDNGQQHYEVSAAGVLGAVAVVVAFMAWFAIVFTGRYPTGLWTLAAFYLRWRVRAVAYTSMLRDEYPPFGEGTYPAELQLVMPSGERNRLTVAFRLILVIPQLIAVWALGLAWGFTSIIAWFAILFTGRYPAALYDFGVRVFRWSTRVEAYLLLLRDEYPPFSLA